MTSKWTAARLSDAKTRCEAAPAGPLVAASGNIWPEPDPRENQVDPVAVCYGCNSDSFALAELFAAAHAHLPAAVAWTEEVCAALGCAPEDVVGKVREMVARLDAWTAPVDVQRTVEDIVTAVYLKPPMSAHDVGELARPHVEKAAQLRRELTECEAYALRLTRTLPALKTAHDASLARVTSGRWDSDTVRAHAKRLSGAAPGDGAGSGAAPVMRHVFISKRGTSPVEPVPAPPAPNGDAPYPDVETLLTEEEKREAWWLGKTTGIGFTAGKQAIADVKIRRMGSPVAELDRMLRVSAAAMTGPAVSTKEAEPWTASRDGDAGNPPTPGTVLTAPHSSALGDDGCGCGTCSASAAAGHAEASDALLAAHRRVDAIADPSRRAAARVRLIRSVHGPVACVEQEGCRVEGSEMVWPDGERYPTNRPGDAQPMSQP